MGIRHPELQAYPGGARPPRRPRSGREKALIVLELATGTAAAASGALLTARPGGAFLHSGPSVLRNTPFRSWRLPGALLAAGCGGGFLLAGLLQLRGHRRARALSVAAGTALVALEVWEAAYIEFQPLVLLYGTAGCAVAVLALSRPSEKKLAPRG